MRAFAFFLLGLLALTAARPACATMAAPLPPAMTHQAHGAHTGCPETPDRATHHACAMASCVGCALDFARMALPVSAVTPRPMARIAATTSALAGSGPAAAIPPPRPVA